jgi:RNA polymerase sigma factor (TIGR02999 family)
MTAENDVSEILEAAVRGDKAAASLLLPLVYDELRRLAALKIAQEAPGQTLQATALVHEAYLRLVTIKRAESEKDERFEGCRHFFAAAAEAMRRILVDRARARNSLKRGGDKERIALEYIEVADERKPDELIALDDALSRLEELDPIKAQLVKLRFFGGLTGEQAALALGVSPSTADNYWAYARAWLRIELRGAGVRDERKAT